MTRMPLDSSFCQQLGQATGPIEFFDRITGRVVGRFVPEPAALPLRPEQGCTDSEDEIRDAIAEARAYPGVGKPLAQIWKELGREP